MTASKNTLFAYTEPRPSPAPSPALRLRFRELRLPRFSIFSLIGLCGGLFGGLLGIGGGSAIAPLLLVTGKLRPAQVAGTTLATVLLISVVGSGAYAAFGHLDLTLAWPIAAGSVAGSTIGALSARRLSPRVMLLVFLLILPYFAAKEFWPALQAPALPAGLVPLTILGVVTGYVSGLLGLSGASLIVPSLVAFFLVDHHTAQGIAMSVAMADSLAGATTHSRMGNINYRVALYMVGPAVAAALVGVFLSNMLSGEILRLIFEGFLTTMSVILLVRLTRGL